LAELAKTLRPPPPADKGKSKYEGKGESAESSIVYDYHDGSVLDLLLRAQVLREYEQFKVRRSFLEFIHSCFMQSLRPPATVQLTHGSFTYILNTPGLQALELRLEKSFRVWVWKWDIQEDLEFGNCLCASDDDALTLPHS
jgi:hypothetical protein